MAIFHCSVKIIGRSTGRSAVAAAAYRAGEKMRNSYDGMTHDYRRKSDVIHSEIILPENSPQEYQNRSVLWNAVEKAERRKDAQTAREVQIALPVEFDRAEQIGVVRQYIKENFVSHGMCADFSLHDKEDGNPHAHILLTTREVSQEGFEKKNREWNDKTRLVGWRENWARVCNARLQEKGLDAKIDHRSLEAQGIDREPTIHEGRHPERIKENREIIQCNQSRTPEAIAEYMQELKEGYVILDKEIIMLKQEASVVKSEISDLRFRADEVIERADHIKNMQSQLAELKAQRQGMGLFESKKAIDTQIQHAERSYEQAQAAFRREFHVEPSEASAEVQRLEYKASDKAIAYERLQDRIAPYIENRGVILMEYQREKLLAEISPEAQQIKDLLKQSVPQGESIRERLARTQNERTFDLVTEKNFRAIVEQVNPAQAQRLIAQREREKVREITRVFDRTR
ncbi:MAG: MobA/MobL family protein [Clostridia bacterium]|nr:MobA/MobL family protein [Clostridia bacterium]